METEPSPMDSHDHQPTAPRGVLLTGNLLFSTMVAGTARAAGLEVAVAEDLAGAVNLCRARPTACVILDLGMAEVDITNTVARLREAAGAVPLIAFGSHVDRARLDEARAAGCAEVLPRSKFSAELAALLRRYVGGAPAT